jgi:hypothetical protein
MNIEQRLYVKQLAAKGVLAPDEVFPCLEQLGASDVWQTREMAATAMVQISKRQARAVLAQ